MKKFTTILLALAMMIAMSITAFAEDTSLTIVHEGEKDYEGYKLLNLTTSLKTDEHHEDHPGTGHEPGCYNYAYTVNSTYRAILQSEVLARGGNYLWPTGNPPASADLITDEQILKYLSRQESDNGEEYNTMRQVADRIYRAIKAAGIAADEADLTGDNDTIEQGYWLFADVTTLEGNDANSLVMVDTKGQDALVINPKTSLPTVEKKVKDIDDSEDENIVDNAWHDSADHDFGDTVPFKLTATLPSNVNFYETYTITFHDTLAEGLTFNPATVKVYMYETKRKADVDVDLNDFADDVTGSFTVKTTDIDDDCTFEVICENVLAFGDVITKDTTFVVYYSATLNSDNTVVIGGAGNTNEVYLEFSNNPYGDGTGVTETDKVTVFTYKIVVNKVDAHNHALKGAGFKLYKKNIDSEFVLLGTELKGDDMTTFEWVGLDDGDYKLEESTVPSGYNKMSDIIFSITAVHSETDGNPSLTTLDGGLMGMGVTGTGTITKDIVNNTGTVLPETGAQGTMLLITCGALLVILAAVFMITRKKMSVYED